MTGAKRMLWAVLGLLAGALLALLLGGAGADAAGEPGRARLHHAVARHAAMDAGGMSRAGTGRALTPRGATHHAATAPSGAALGNPVRGAAARVAVALRAAGTRSNPGRLLVTATEFRLALSRPSVHPGVVVVELLVAGEDPHDLALRRLDRRGRPVGRTLHIARVTPGALGDAEFRLAAGTWRLECTIPGHARMGMRATLRVR
jgi:hypothetical protein